MISEPISRVIGEYTCHKKGPLVVVIAGIHGNEPSGYEAAKKVVQRFEEEQPDFRGKFLALVGNIPALASGKRFIDHDMNRLWSQEEIERIHALSFEDRNTEEKQVVEIIEIFEKEVEKGYEEVVLLDLHSTSAPNGLFSIVTNEPRNRELASALHAPVLFGLADALSNSTTSAFIQDRKISGLAFEGGQHAEPSSVDNHLAAIWLLIEKVGCVNFDRKNPTIDLDNYHKQLIQGSRHLPHYVRVIHKHIIHPGDEFRMLPGFDNFHEVYKGETLAHSDNGDIHCPHSGMILMPLYQSQGEDGFFIMEKLMEPPF